MYFYSASTNVFIHDSMKESYIDAGTYPDDLLPVSDDVFDEFSASEPPAGKKRGAADGLPVWVDVPRLTVAELIAIAEAEKSRRLEHVSTNTELWRTQLSLGMLSDADKEKLKEWMLYAQAVQAVDTIAPDINWPKGPIT